MHRIAIRLTVALTTLLSPAFVCAQLESIPKDEVFVARPGLQVSLTSNPHVVTVGQPLALKAVFRNTGRETLFLNPHLALNLFIETESGDQVRSTGGIAEIIGIEVQPNEFVRLRPGATWRTLVRPSRRGQDPASFVFYADPGSGRLFLSPGSYRLRIECINIPGYVSSYDLQKAPAAVWEGKLTAHGSLTIAPLSAVEERKLLARFATGRLSGQEFDTLVANAGSQTLDMLLDRVRRSSADAPRIVEALASSLRPGVLSRIVEATSSLELLPSTTWYLGAGAPTVEDCRSAETLVLRAMGHQLSPFVRECESVRDMLRRLVEDPAVSADTRGNAASFLGSGGQSADVSLLARAVREGSPRTSRRLSSADDPLRSGAVRGISAMRGRDATAALISALTFDEARAYRAEIVRSLAERSDVTATPAIIDILSDSDPRVVGMALSALTGLGAKTALPKVLPLVSHADSSVRAAARNFAARFSDDPAFLEMMRADLVRGDRHAQATAVSYVGRQGDASDLAELEAKSTSADPAVRSSAITALQRLGTEATTQRVRELLGTSGWRDSQLKSLLFQLTFAFLDSEADWQRWWDAHKSSTRLEWALAALRDSLPLPPGAEAARGGAALGYLTERDQPQARLAIEGAVNAGSWTNRIAAAYAIRLWSPETSQRLLARELRNRDYHACQRVAELLEEPLRDDPIQVRLTRPFEEGAVDCRDPESRARAIAKWLPQ